MRPSCRAPIFGGGPGTVVCCFVDFPRSKSPPERLIYSEGAGGALPVPQRVPRAEAHLKKFGGSNLETGAGPLASRAANHVLAVRAQENSVALLQLKALGEQAIVAVAASLGEGGAVLKAQLIASRFYEAVRDELEESSIDDAKRSALIAASDRCERIAAASINPNALLNQLKNAVAVLQADTVSAPPTRARPVLRVIEGGLSKS